MPDGPWFLFFQSPLWSRSYRTIYRLSESYNKNTHLLKCFDATSLCELLIISQILKNHFNMPLINYN